MGSRVEKFVSVTRATLKGTVLIGVAQGMLGGLAFWAGLDGAIFWGTVMTLLSIVPGIGGALVWVPAAIFLVAEERSGKASRSPRTAGSWSAVWTTCSSPRLVRRARRCTSC